MEPADLADLDGQVVAILTSAGRPVTAEQAGIIRGRIMGRKKLRDPAAYVAAAVRKDPAAAFALLHPVGSSVNGRHPPAAEVLAARGNIKPEVAARGAALARKLLALKTAAREAAEQYHPTESDTEEDWPF